MAQPLSTSCVSLYFPLSVPGWDSDVPPGAGACARRGHGSEHQGYDENVGTKTMGVLGRLLLHVVWYRNDAVGYLSLLCQGRVAAFRVEIGSATDNG